MARHEKIKRAGIKKLDGTYELKEFAVDCDNVIGLEDRAVAAKAKQDKNGKDVTSYIAKVERDDKGIVVQNGDLEKEVVDLTMKGATVEEPGVAGIVPSSDAGDQDKFLKADGTWAEIPNPSIVKGAEKNYDGAEGLVPQPKAGDQDRVFQGDGTWGHKLQMDIIVENGVYGYVAGSQGFVPFKSQSDIDAAVQAARKGNATAADVVEGYTFTNEKGSNLVGSLPYFSSNGSYSLSDEGPLPSHYCAVGEPTMIGMETLSSYDDQGNIYSQRSPSLVVGITKKRCVCAPGDKLLLELSPFGTASATDVLEGTTYTSFDGYKKEGRMADRSGWVSVGLKAGESVRIPEGFHDGTGKVSAASLMIQTNANAEADHILKGKTAWVNGSKVTGTMTDNGTWSGKVGPGQTIRIPNGRHENSQVTGTGVSSSGIIYFNTRGDWRNKNAYLESGKYYQIIVTDDAIIG